MAFYLRLRIRSLAHGPAARLIGLDLAIVPLEEPLSTGGAPRTDQDWIGDMTVGSRPRSDVAVVGKRSADVADVHSGRAHAVRLRAAPGAGVTFVHLERVRRECGAPSVPMTMRQTPPWSLPLRAEVTSSHGHAAHPLRTASSCRMEMRPPVHRLIRWACNMATLPRRASSDVKRRKPLGATQRSERREPKRDQSRTSSGRARCKPPEHERN